MNLFTEHSQNDTITEMKNKGEEPGQYDSEGRT